MVRKNLRRTTDGASAPAHQCGKLAHQMIEERITTPSAIAPKATTIAKRPSRFSRYAPLIIWATLIFVGSSDLLAASHTAGLLTPLRWLFPSASEATLGAIHFLLRKAGHFTEYAILAWLAARAFRSSSQNLFREYWFWISLAFIIVYSLSDEFHQSFVPSRTPSIYDSLIDSVGGLTTLVIMRTRRRRVRTGSGSERI